MVPRIPTQAAVIEKDFVLWEMLEPSNRIIQKMVSVAEESWDKPGRLKSALIYASQAIVPDSTLTNHQPINVTHEA